MVSVDQTTRSTQRLAALPSIDVPAVESVWTVVVGGGTGARFGGPKQYEDLGPRRVIDHAIAAAEAASDGVVVVVPAADAAREGAVAAGSTRSASVRNGLRAVPDVATIICIHDAARPLASEALFRAVVAEVANGADGAVPGVPVTDTIKRVGDPIAATEVRPVVETLHRDALVAVQTPQAFRASVLRSAHATGDDATDDSALVERLGHRVVVVAGEPDNRKITRPDDLRWARSVIGAGA